MKTPNNSRVGGCGCAIFAGDMRDGTYIVGCVIIERSVDSRQKESKDMNTVLDNNGEVLFVADNETANEYKENIDGSVIILGE